jgi:hypothetical protein
VHDGLAAHTFLYTHGSQSSVCYALKGHGCVLSLHVAPVVNRFHFLPEFDDGKRSCRKRLADHNRRRRKPQLSALTCDAAVESIGMKGEEESDLSGSPATGESS